MTADEIDQHFDNVQKISLGKDKLQELDFINLIVEPTIALRKTKTDARRLIQQGGFKINDK